MTPADLAIELALDRAEAARSPAWLTSAAARDLCARAAASPDPSLRVRATTLTRWILAAHVPTSSAPRTLAGLASRHRALAATAHRLGLATSRALLSGIHGRIPDKRGQVPVDNSIQSGTYVSYPQEPVPIWEALAAVHGLETAGIEWREGRASETVTLAPGHARMVIGEASDEIAVAGLELHEAGHALYRAQQQGMGLLAAAPPARWFDEAIAAWAVRALEDERFVADEGGRREAAARRVRREALTERLAGFEDEVMDGADIEAAWARTGLRDPAAWPALFDEPGVMASYVAADRARLEPRPGEVRAWARAGAALDLA